MIDNSWLNLNPRLPPGSTSQVFLGYDPKNEMLMTWGGHLYGGGYPQIDDLYTYDVSNLKKTNTWKLENTLISNTSDIPIGGCLSGGIYDIKNELMFKRGQHIVDTHEYYRKANLEKWPWLYDFNIHKWFDMGAFNYRDGSNYGAGVCYDTDNQIIMVLDTRNNIKDRTIIYDAYENKITLIPINTWEDLGGTRGDMGLVYDSKRHRFVVVGGMWVGAYEILHWYNDIWIFDFDNKTWIKEDVINPEIIPVDGWVASDAVYDSINDKIIMFLGFNINGTTGEDHDGRYVHAYAYDPETKMWEKLNDKPEYFGGHRGLDLNASFSVQHNITFVLDSATLSKTWAYRYSSDAAIPIIPDPPIDMSLSTTSNSAIITWDSEDPEIKEYNIYRGQADDSWDVQYTKIDVVPSSSNTYVDSSVMSGIKYFYYITGTDYNDKESNSSSKVRTQPPVIKEGYVSIKDSTQIRVVWTSLNDNNDIQGYNVYRSECMFETYPINIDLNLPGELDQYERQIIKSIVEPTESDYIKINSNLITTTEYIDNVNLINSDENIDYPYQLFLYKIRSVNNLGIESGWSPYFITIPNPPTGLKVTPSASDYYLAWTAPHNIDEIKGYRIYTTYDRHGVKELTTDIITTTNAIIPMSEILDSTQKFYVTAIDSIDQEGSPSSGVWGNRIYGEFYEQYLNLDVVGDINKDGITDIKDYISFLNTMGKQETEQGYNTHADYDNNNKITYSDFKTWYGYYKIERGDF